MASLGRVTAAGVAPRVRSENAAKKDCSRRKPASIEEWPRTKFVGHALIVPWFSLRIWLLYTFVLFQNHVTTWERKHFLVGTAARIGGLDLPAMDPIHKIWVVFGCFSEGGPYAPSSNNKNQPFFWGGKEKKPPYISTSLSVDVIYWIYHCYVRWLATW